jgi:hypothetical protein
MVVSIPITELPPSFAYMLGGMVFSACSLGPLPVYALGTSVAGGLTMADHQRFSFSKIETSSHVNHSLVCFRSVSVNRCIFSFFIEQAPVAPASREHSPIVKTSRDFYPCCCFSRCSSTKAPPRRTQYPLNVILFHSKIVLIPP